MLYFRLYFWVNYGMRDTFDAHSTLIFCERRHIYHTYYCITKQSQTISSVYQSEHDFSVKLNTGTCLPCVRTNVTRT